MGFRSLLFSTTHASLLLVRIILVLTTLSILDRGYFFQNVYFRLPAVIIFRLAQFNLWIFRDSQIRIVALIYKLALLGYAWDNLGRSDGLARLFTPPQVQVIVVPPELKRWLLGESKVGVQLRWDRRLDQRTNAESTQGIYERSILLQSLDFVTVAVRVVLKVDAFIWDVVKLLGSLSLLLLPKKEPLLPSLLLLPFCLGIRFVPGAIRGVLLDVIQGLTSKNLL